MTDRNPNPGERLSIYLTIRSARPIVKQVPNQSGSLDQVFQALADPTRRAMVERLVRGPASVSELSRPLAMSLPAVMQHLQVLQACGLIRSQKAGRVRTCHIEPARLRAAEAWIVSQRTAWESRLDRLGEYLAEPGTTESQGTTGNQGTAQSQGENDSRGGS
jgi:DNA-binding transcriptional ArsR family regulator